jgi:hypothetical protein
MTISAHGTLLTAIMLQEFGSVGMYTNSALPLHPAIPAMENARLFPWYAHQTSRRARMVISARPTLLTAIKLRERGSVQMNLHIALLAQPAIPATENAKLVPLNAQHPDSRATITISARPTLFIAIKIQEFGAVRMYTNIALPAHPAIPAMENARQFPWYAPSRSRRAMMEISAPPTLLPVMTLWGFGSVQVYPNSALPDQPAIPAMENA